MLRSGQYAMINSVLILTTTLKKMKTTALNHSL